jgi:predicted metalloprotease with PDZ domain
MCLRPVGVAAALFLALAWGLPATAQDSRPAWLGAWIDGLTKTPAEAGGQEREIVYITALDQDGPAHGAGLRPLDQIMAIDGRAVHTVTEAMCVVRAARPHQIVVIAIERQAEMRNVPVTLAEWPEARNPAALECPPAETSMRSVRERLVAAVGTASSFGRVHLDRTPR